MKTKRKVFHYSGTHFEEKEDDVVTEYPLTIMLNGEEFATMVCTPTHLKELVVGFLASEGIILFYDEDIKSIDIDETRGFAYVELKKAPRMSSNFHSKRFIGSCCGKSRQSFYFQNDVRTAKVSRSRVTIHPDTCLKLMADMQGDSHVFKETGGVHNAALCAEEGIVVARTDIGRHNALDKIYGYCLIDRIPIKDKILAFSGRISSEVLLKVSKIGVGIILSKSAPTALALDMADELNITAVGFIRGGKMNVYTHSERINI
ncbi:formate dehydrogenase accessory sulfurtransferase FdhD [Caldalkalibacillus salinus]|uniref:formate dehydrogenase accessory sulfurtransferase FdhD n=1 Tax=Caldalkalibacillus salinus TaxID=2803787 RepID=UPI0019223C8E|nr:formate dehydrogenase accessory sulfurtransferase FdhD [Caldalkalibacillus salinus]